MGVLSEAASSFHLSGPTMDKLAILEDKMISAVENLNEPA
jgi:hypothetical protein